MKTLLHKADSRGFANHGWLQAKHTFSFANYFDSERIHFGALRVLNDDKVDSGMGFGMHPHANMEIITIPLSGDLRHKDSMGNEETIHHGEVQIMSAGTGIQHSEFNPNHDQSTELLQIWVIPNQENVTPRYQQFSIDLEGNNNKLIQIVSPEKSDSNGWIYQNAWFQLGRFDENQTETYKLHHPENGVYAFVIEGEISIENTTLAKRDGMGISETTEFAFQTKTNSTILLMEVPMITL